MAKSTYVVLQEFRDKDNFDKKYEVGEEVSFDGQRLETLTGLGLIQQKGGEKASDPSKTDEDKQTVFTEVPTPPYKIGDTWQKGQEVFKAVKGKAKNGKFADADWELVQAEPTPPADNTGEGGEGNGTGGSNPLLD
ncbi:hypothetical protein BWI93_03115 [Siphonobacter sp. BAB-5385]|uniref:hypothetical protein n=1 Tax=Siphonobacter sp. BAB-5385 TaxID=1864822 RepID=UPI000B9DE920|nr:hypothetical protein [Siphonobacter sp. BAB-5385]OZI09586.1 hypothetical protein BWI93_03115 [Siphonobacter sp. BAB-5385]